MAASLYFKAGNRTTDFLVKRSLATCQLADLRFSDSDVVSIIFFVTKNLSGCDQVVAATDVRREPRFAGIKPFQKKSLSETGV